MKKITAFISCLVAAFLISQCGQSDPMENDPIISFTHGVLIGPDGVYKPDMEYLINIQNYFISKYRDSLAQSAQDESSNIERNIYAKVSDKVLANALYLDWIVGQLNSAKISTLSVANNSLRWYYVKNIQEDPVLPKGNENWSKGIEKRIALELEETGLNVFTEAHAGSPKYIEDCLSAGVPIPDKIFDDRWESLGILSDQILFNPSDSELQIYLSNDPPGFCLSMIRHDAEGIGNHFDLICFGTESNNVCFFESSESGVTVGQELNISSLYAGEEVFGGTCINCHLGENPFIVHPSDEPFIAAASKKGEFFGTPYNLNGTDWFNAIGVPSWPKNPPPFENLKDIPSDKKCTSCHTSLNAGRFPDLSQVDDISAFEQYCTIIFPATLGEKQGFAATMPKDDVNDIAKYIAQINYLKYACDGNPPEGKIVDNPYGDDPTVLSPPQVIDPLTQCAKIIYIDGFIQKAEVTLLINNIEVEKIIQAEGADPLVFTNIGELKIGDSVQTTQSIDGFSSPLSFPVIVTNYKSIYPDGFPQPVIDPATIYECASVMAVLYDIPGLEVEVKINGGNPVTAYTFAGYQPIKPGKTPFVIGDEFTAQIKACDEISPVSNAINSQQASSTVDDAIINNESLYVGQTIINIGNLTYGSNSTVVNQASGIVGTFSTPMSWKNFHLGNPLLESDQLFVSQKLCDVESDPPVRSRINPCETLPAPVIRGPRSGDKFVIVLESISGSRVHVYDSDGNELGDSNLNLIYLNRELISGESILAFMQVGDCISPVAFEILVE